ncbi:hypothetical protein QOZ80_3AG0223860 [Eleusine coracana subsp. coracana]|nr:hypothetical protein QOZ80_3AG0223860 [Eleusine coracana subsp. coracana]
MDASAVLALQIIAVVIVSALLLAVIVSAWCARGPVGGAAVHDVERALGPATIMTYEQAAASGAEDRKAQQCCAICLSEYAGGDELVRVVPACGHFFHAGCGVDAWLRARRTCPLCRGGLWPLPRPPRPECAPMPPRAGRGTVCWL